MNWKDLASAGKSVGKLDSLDVGQSTRDTMEAIMCAMAASGKVQEMALIAQTIEKVSTQVDMKEVSANLADLIAMMKAQAVTKPVTGLKNTEVSDIGHALTSISDRLSLLEGK
tara:strand:- start:400 stop:738 length:339 start_codon:yes stop_codon:yes gene_type:complete